MIIKKICYFGLVLVLVSISNIVFADEPEEETSYIKYIGNNNEYVFVMLGNDYSGNDVDKKKQKEINEKYEYSGLYTKDNAESPLWTINFYEYKGNLFISNDGNYIARIFSWPQIYVTLRDNSSKMITYFNKIEAIHLYNKGTIFKNYNISTFIEEEDNEYIRYSVSHFSWLNNIEFNSNNNTLYLKTVADKEYTIDIVTGEIVKIDKEYTSDVSTEEIIKTDKEYTSDVSTDNIIENNIPETNNNKILKVIIIGLITIISFIIIIFLIKRKSDITEEE